jgi:cytoskeletal protein CcmA (bactofilin family)
MSTRSAGPGEYLPADAEMGMDQAAEGAVVTGYSGSDSYSLIDRHSNFDGTFHSDRDVRIEGEVKGTIDCQGTLFVAQGANVTAKVEAEHIAVAGDLNGDIHCRGKLQIMPSGRVRGKVTTQLLVINEGAFYEGQLEMAKPEERQSPPRPLPSVAAVSPPPPDGPPSGEPRQPRPPAAAPADASGAPSSTFIRRFGGPETPWEGRPDEEENPQPPRDS